MATCRARDFVLSAVPDGQDEEETVVVSAFFRNGVERVDDFFRKNRSVAHPTEPRPFLHDSRAELIEPFEKQSVKVGQFFFRPFLNVFFASAQNLPLRYRLRGSNR